MSYLRIAQTVEVEDVDCLDLSEIIIIFEVFPVPFRRCNLCIVTDCTISHCKIKEPGEKRVLTVLKVH